MLDSKIQRISVSKKSRFKKSTFKIGNIQKKSTFKKVNIQRSQKNCWKFKDQENKEPGIWRKSKIQEYIKKSILSLIRFVLMELTLI